MKLLGKITMILQIISAGMSTLNAQNSVHEKMVLISGGTYSPLYSSGEKKEVGKFYMDVYPVTNEEYLEFVQANPQWKKSKVKKIFADKSYLRHWKSDDEIGNDNNLNSPVTNISWFAAKAYAEWKGKRLPTVDEWEFAASAGLDKKDGANDPATIKRIQEWYSKLSSKNLAAVGSTEKNYWGLYDMFGLIWEWTYDFNTALVTGESRGDSNLERNLFCGSGSVSASDVQNYPAFMRYGFRSSLKANYTVPNLGFRCVKDYKIKKEKI
jgi:formylglycine-generating enzyme